MSLTADGVRTIVSLTSSEADQSFKPVLQLISIEVISNEDEDQQSYRAVLSDGSHFVQGMLATQLNQMVQSNELQNNTVICVQEFMTQPFQGRNEISILKISVVSNPGNQIGSPTDIEKEEPRSTRSRTGARKIANASRSSLSKPSTKRKTAHVVNQASGSRSNLCKPSTKRKTAPIVNQASDSRSNQNKPSTKRKTAPIVNHASGNSAGDLITPATETPRREETEETPAAASGTPHLDASPFRNQHAPWQNVWSKLAFSDWICKATPHGKIYTHPNVHEEFTEEGVQEYAKKHYGWLGERRSTRSSDPKGESPFKNKTFGVLWKRNLKEAGWTQQKAPQPIDWYYVRPGRSVANGVEGEDYFISTDAVIDFCANCKEYQSSSSSESEVSPAEHLARDARMDQKEEEVFIYEGGNQVVPANVVRMSTHPNCKTIEAEAFVNRKFLREAKLSEGLVDIKEGAFRGCEWLQYIITPSTARTIGDRAFSGCINLRYVKFNERLKKIGREAFKEIFIKYLALPQGLKTLNYAAFAECLYLLKVALPPGLKQEIKGAFKGCNNLELIGKPPHVKLGKGCIPQEIQESINIEDTNHKEVWKQVYEKNEEVYAEWKQFREAEKGVKDVKPNIQSLVGEATPSEDAPDSSKELNEMAGKLQKTEEERDTLQVEKERLAQESEASIKALQAEKERLAHESETRMKALQLDMETKMQKANEEKELLKQANLKLEQENEGRQKAKEETDAKLQNIADSLHKERTEKSGTMERLQIMTTDCRALKAENARLKQEKQDKEALLLKAAMKCGALEEKNKRLRKELRRGGHESVVSEEDEAQNDLEGISIGLGSQRAGPTERSKLSSVTGEEVFESCAEDESRRSSPREESKRSRRKRKRSSEEKSAKSDQGTVALARLLQEVGEIRKKLQAETASKSPQGGVAALVRLLEEVSGIKKSLQTEVASKSPQGTDTLMELLEEVEDEIKKNLQAGAAEATEKAAAKKVASRPKSRRGVASRTQTI